VPPFEHSDGDEIYTELNAINELLIDTQKSNAKLIDESLLKIDEFFNDHENLEFSSELMKMQLEDQRLPEVPRIRHKRQVTSSACLAVKALIASTQTQLNAAIAAGAAAATRLASAKAMLATLQAAAPTGFIMKLINSLLINVWKRIVAAQETAVGAAAANVAKLEQKLADLKAQEAAACASTTTSSTSSSSSTATTTTSPTTTSTTTTVTTTQAPTTTSTTSTTAIPTTTTSTATTAAPTTTTIITTTAGSTTTAGPISTLPPVSCTHAQDLFDPSGNYISSVCYIVTSLTNANAATACQSLGHKLLTVTTTAEGDALNAYTQSNFGATWYVWMSGRLIGSTWTDSNDGSTPVPTPSMPTDTSRNGDCLRYHISMGGSQYQVSTWNCSDPCDSYCEFVNPNPVTPTTTTTTTKAPPTCANKQDLFDTSGNYISSVCYITDYMNNQDAVDACKSIGYTLFTVTSAAEADALKTFMFTVLLTSDWF
jgi:cytoskeletal protein RodZ